MSPSGVPLYFSVYVTNQAGETATAICSLSTYDVTLPGGRMGVAFRSTSNPRVLKATVTVYEDSPITESRVAVGYGKGVDGSQIVGWTTVNLQENVVDYNVGKFSAKLCCTTKTEVI